jgi:hypothetical protein
MLLTHHIVSEKIKVLKTTRDLSKFEPTSGGELKFSSLHELEELTICARFMTYQFSTHLYALPFHSLLQYEGITLLGSYVMLPPPSMYHDPGMVEPYIFSRAESSQEARI